LQRASALRAGKRPDLEARLVDRLHAHRNDVGAARRLQQRFGVGCISLVALDLGAHVRRGQEPGLNAQAAEPALAFDQAPVGIGNRKLEDGLGQIDAHDGQRGGSIHLGLSSVER